MNVKYLIYGVILFVSGIGVGMLLLPLGEEPHEHSAGPGSESSETWTCSMHPQIRQNEPGLCPICEMDLIPLSDMGSGSDDPRLLQMTPEAARLAMVETMTVGGVRDRQDAVHQIPVEGTIRLDERTVLTQTAHVGGRIEKMHVNFEGEFVQKGQKIATIYSTELLAATKELMVAKKYESTVPGMMDAARQKLVNWNLTEARIDEIMASGESISTIDLLAEHAGYVIRRFKSTGEYVETGGPLYTVGNTGSLWVIFNVFESDLGNVQRGDEILFTTPSLANDTFQSRVTYINPMLSSSNTAEVRTGLRNRGQKLKPGMLAKGMIRSAGSSAGRDENALVVPKSAVLWTGPRSVVYVSEKGYDVPTYGFREVEIEEADRDHYRVLKGLEAGEEIVVHGAFAIDAAAQLNQNASMMNRDVRVKKEENQQVPDFRSTAPSAFISQLEELTLAYLALKDALVRTDAVDARSAAALMRTRLEEADMSLLDGAMHQYWMERLDAIGSHLDLLQAADGVKAERAQFEFISMEMILALQAYGTAGDTMYVQHCPMAFNNRGADWISAEEQIRNPYFGDRMMKCGVVKNTLTGKE